MYRNNKIKIKPVLEPQEANKINKTLKIGEKIYAFYIVKTAQKSRNFRHIFTN